MTAIARVAILAPRAGASVPSCPREAGVGIDHADR